VSGRERSRFAALLVATAFAACTEVDTAPDAVLSIQFDSLPAAAVVLGDTMRGGDLLAAPVRANAFNAAGDSLASRAVRLVPLDDSSATAFVYDSTRRLIVGARRISAARVVARAGDVQSQVQTFAVVPAPTRITRPDTVVRDSIIYNELLSTNRARDIAVFLARDSAGTLFPVNGLRVRFRLVRSPAAARFDSVRIVNSAGRATESVIQSGGAATLRVRVFPKPAYLDSVFTDTLTVEALARVRADTLRRQVLVRIVRRT
jgi:hypothetical protein